MGKEVKVKKEFNKKTFWKLTGVTAMFAAWSLASFLIVQLGIGNLINLLVYVGVPLADVNQSVFLVVANIVAWILTILLVIGLPWLAFKNKTSPKDLGLGEWPAWCDFGWLGLGFVLYLVLTFVTTFISMLLLSNVIDFNQKQVTGFESISTQSEYILAFIGLVIVAPIAEEVLFRGYLFGKLKKAGIKTWVAIVVTSLMFAVAHFQGNVGIDVFALSVVLCLLRVWSGSLWPSIMLHMLKNGIAYYFLFINPSILSTIGG